MKTSLERVDQAAPRESWNPRHHEAPFKASCSWDDSLLILGVSCSHFRRCWHRTCSVCKMSVMKGKKGKIVEDSGGAVMILMNRETGRKVVSNVKRGQMNKRKK